MEYKGRLYLINDTVIVSDKFKKRSFVVTDDHDKYPQFIEFQLTQDRCMVLDNFNEGDMVDVIFHLKGREWENPQGEVKYFNTNEAFKIKRLGQEQDMSATTYDDSVPF